MSKLFSKWGFIWEWADNVSQSAIVIKDITLEEDIFYDIKTFTGSSWQALGIKNILILIQCICLMY